jgi:hypothetical protein
MAKIPVSIRVADGFAVKDETCRDPWCFRLALVGCGLPAASGRSAILVISVRNGKLDIPDMTDQTANAGLSAPNHYIHGV